MQVISQSFIKELFEYKMKNGCGLQFEARHVKGMEFPSSPAMNLGSWFEYRVYGANNKVWSHSQTRKTKAKKTN